MAVILPDDLLAMQLPQARIVIRACGDQIRGVSAEGTIPHPALVARESGLERERLRVAVLVGLLGLLGINLPNFGSVVSRAGCKLLGIGREQDSRNVLFVGVEVGYGLEVGAVKGLDEGPDEDVAIVVGRAQQGTVSRHCDTRHAHILLRNQLMTAIVLGQIPDLDTTRAVAADDLALVRVDDHIVGGAAMVVAALNGAGTCFPDLDSAILRTSHHPLALAMERDAGDVAGVALKCQQRVWIGALDVKQFDGVVAGGREEALVGRDA